MARTALPVTTISRSGVVGTPVVSTLAGHVIAVNDGRTFLEIVSTDAGSQTVSIEIAQTVDGQTVAARVVTVPAGATRKAGPFPTNVYSQTTAVAANVTLTSDGTAPANNDTVTVDVHAYTFKTTLTGAANEVLIGASAAAALTNLKSAINATAGAGTTYGTGTVAHTTVTGSTLTSTTLLLVALTGGVAGDLIASTETSAHLVFGTATLTGGFEIGAVLVDPSIAATLSITAYTLSLS